MMGVRQSSSERGRQIFFRWVASIFNSTTGLFLTLHNWQGKNGGGAPSSKVLATRYNTICIAVDYLQSGPATVEAYDFGYLQSLDALRALRSLNTRLSYFPIPSLSTTGRN